MEKQQKNVRRKEERDPGKHQMTAEQLWSESHVIYLCMQRFFFLSINYFDILLYC